MDNTNLQVNARRKVTFTMTERNVRRLKMLVIWSGRSQQDIIETDLLELLDEFEAKQADGLLAERGLR